MGLGNSSASKTYLGIKEGKVAHRKGDNSTDYYDHITGFLTDIYVKEDGKFGRELHIVIRDGQDLYVLQMRLESGYARAFLRVIKNAALAEPVTIIPIYKVTEEGQQAGMIVTQNGSALKWYYTRTQPNGLPELEPCKMKDPKTGKLVDGWDNTKQMQFLVQMLYSEIRPVLTPAKVGMSRDNVATVRAAGNAEAQATNEMHAAWHHQQQLANSHNEDDLPF
jgi:hypothetical protein